MSSMHTNFIDFRDEHRIYYFDGYLRELVGMIIITKIDKEEFSEAVVGNNLPKEPETWYKFVCDTYMGSGGIYKEDLLPDIFAYRDGEITLSRLVRYLLLNIHYRVDNPIVLIEDLSSYNLTVSSEGLGGNGIEVFLYPMDTDSYYRIETSICESTFMYLSENKGKLSLRIDRKIAEGSVYWLIRSFAEIIYALQEYFHREDIRILQICVMAKDGLNSKPTVVYSKWCERFPYLVDLYVKKERAYWKKLSSCKKDVGL